MDRLIGLGRKPPFDRLNVGLTIEDEQNRHRIIGWANYSQNHLPGLALCPEAQVVALCDNGSSRAQRASQQVASRHLDRLPELLRHDDIHAVIIAAKRCACANRARRHRRRQTCALREANLMNHWAMQMYQAAERAGVRHMTALPTAYCRQCGTGAPGQDGCPWPALPFSFLPIADWGKQPLGWRQVAARGTGELGDMLSHRIDFSHLLFGRMTRLVANTKRFIDDRQGQVSDLEDWATILADFENGASGVLESSKVATGRNESWRSQDYVEVNGSEGTFVFYTERWNELQAGTPGGIGLEKVIIPEEFWKSPASRRDVHQGDPLVTFRYDQAFEFIDAIVNRRACQPSFLDGVRAQAVTDAAMSSAKENRWIDVASI